MNTIDLSRKFGLTPPESDFDKYARMAKTLADLARDHSVTIMTATQCPRENTDPIYSNPVIGPDFIIIDHMSLIKYESSDDNV